MARLTIKRYTPEQRALIYKTAAIMVSEGNIAGCNAIAKVIDYDLFIAGPHELLRKFKEFALFMPSNHISLWGMWWDSPPMHPASLFYTRECGQTNQRVLALLLCAEMCKNLERTKSRRNGKVNKS